MKTSAVFAAALLLGSPVAYPFAHLWDIQEVYTNADGTVQFVEFFTTGTAEFFLSSTQLQFQISGTVVNTFNFPNDLSGPTTANHTFLAGTSNFAALYGITPDYIIPANFLNGGANRTLEFGPFFDEISLVGLPTNGVMSLNGIPGNDVPSATSLNNMATPRNFAGLEITIPEPTTANVLTMGAFAALAARRRRQKRLTRESGRLCS